MERISCIIGTAGHIDHGKTSLVKTLTGIDTDRLAEEKKRGVSIDLGFAYLDLDLDGVKVRAGLIDVPGHERFIKNMLAGATGMDLVIFVVAADDGVMPQTREHLDIVHLLGINKGIFVITKSDLVDKERISEVKREIETLIDNTSLKGASIIPASSATGEGIEELKGLIKAKIIESKREDKKGFFRLPVDRSFSVKGFGAVVTGTVASGSIKKGEEAFIFPSGEPVKVRGIQSLYMEAGSVSSGERAALNLSGVAHKDVKRGHILASPLLKRFSDYQKTGSRQFVDCSFEFIGSKGSLRRVVKNRSVLKVHHLTGEALAVIQFAGKKEVAAGERAYGRLILKNPLLLMRGDRFILRDPSINSTIGGGVAKIAYLSKELMPKISRLTPPEGEGAKEALKGLLDGRSGIESTTASLMLNVTDEELKKTIEEGNGFGSIGNYIVSADKAGGLKKRIKDIIAAFHVAHPMEAGTKEDELIKLLKEELKGIPDKHGFLKEILGVLISSKEIRKEGATYAASGFHPASTGIDSKIENAILQLFSKDFAPPLSDDIKKLPFGKTEIEKVLSYLQKNGAIVKLKEGSYISGSAIKVAKEKLTDFLKAKPGIKAADFRDILGCGRKLAIEILEYFDKERVTLRAGDIRTLR